jgi:signal transduction histidine kinase
MWSGSLRPHLLPGAAERDEGFCQEILRIGHSGLPVVAAVEIGVTVFMVAARFVVAPEPATLSLRLLEAGLVLAIGAATFVLSRIQATYAYSRAIGLASCSMTVLVLNWFRLLGHQYDKGLDFVLVQVTAIMLVAVAALPLRPMQTLALGVWIGASHMLLVPWLAPSAGLEPAYQLFVSLLAVVTTGLTAVLYEERRAAYGLWLQTVRAIEDLREAHSKILLSEHAASLSRLTSALSHELNSPLGALISGVDTLLLTAAKQATSPPAEQDRLVRLQTDLRRSVQESARRLQQTVERMQRFSNLDRAEIQEANLSDLLADVCALAAPQTSGKIALELDLNQVPPLTCRPQQLSAVFSSLLNNSIRALKDGGRIVISARQRDAQIEVEIRDNGCGVAPEQLRTILDPGFRVSEARVITGNWSMFSSRQIVREHGGEIRVVSEEGRGTVVTVTLPLRNTGLRP